VKWVSEFMLYTFIKSYPHRKLWDCVTECVENKVVKFVIQLCNIYPQLGLTVNK